MDNVIPNRLRTTKVVYWEPLGINGQGEYTLDSPQELLVRIEESVGDTLDPLGNKVAYSLSMNVGQRVVVGGYVWVGALDDLVSNNIKVMKIIGYEQTPNLGILKYDRWAYLAHHRDKLSIA